MRIRAGNGYSIVYVDHEGHQEAIGAMAAAPDAVDRMESAAEIDRVDVDAGKVFGRYERWLARQPLDGRTRDAYSAQGRGFVDWLAGSEHGGAALVEAHGRDWAVRDYKRHIKTTKRWSPASINQALAAVDNFYRSAGIDRPEVPREDLAAVAPRALAEGEQRAFLRAVEACRQRGTGRSPRSCSTPGCASPRWPVSTPRTCRSASGGVG